MALAGLCLQTVLFGVQPSGTGWVGWAVLAVIFFLGASGNSVGLRVEVEAAAVEVDGGLEVVPVAVAACRDADGLDT